MQRRECERLQGQEVPCGSSIVAAMADPSPSLLQEEYTDSCRSTRGIFDVRQLGRISIILIEVERERNRLDDSLFEQPGLTGHLSCH
jgi:hypothetical protein